MRTVIFACVRNTSRSHLVGQVTGDRARIG